MHGFTPMRISVLTRLHTATCSQSSGVVRLSAWGHGTPLPLCARSLLDDRESLQHRVDLLRHRLAGVILCDEANNEDEHGGAPVDALRRRSKARVDRVLESLSPM